MPRASIGAIHNVQPCLPATPADADAADLLGAYWNAAFPDPQCLGHYPSELVERMEPHIHPGDLARICRPLDWFGLNHYSPIYATDNPNSPLGVTPGAAPADISRTPVDWPIMPEALRETLHQVHNRYGLPIYVTENGFGGQDGRRGAAGPIKTLAAARGTSSSTCTHSIGDARVCKASKKCLFHRSIRYCTSSCKSTMSIKNAVRLHASTADRPDQNRDAESQNRANKYLYPGAALLFGSPFIGVAWRACAM